VLLRDFLDWLENERGVMVAGTTGEIIDEFDEFQAAEIAETEGGEATP
jgi:hypothetical protein